MGGSGLSGHGGERKRSGLFFKCNDGDAASDLWSECELGGSCPARGGRLLEEWKEKGKKIETKKSKVEARVSPPSREVRSTLTSI